MFLMKNESNNFELPDYWKTIAQEKNSLKMAIALYNYVKHFISEGEILSQEDLAALSNTIANKLFIEYEWKVEEVNNMMGSFVEFTKYYVEKENIPPFLQDVEQFIQDFIEKTNFKIDSDSSFSHRRPVGFFIDIVPPQHIPTKEQVENKHIIFTKKEEFPKKKRLVFLMSFLNVVFQILLYLMIAVWWFMMMGIFCT